MDSLRRPGYAVNMRLLEAVDRYYRHGVLRVFLVLAASSLFPIAACSRKVDPIRLLDDNPRARPASIGGDSRRSLVFAPGAGMRMRIEEPGKAALVTALAVLSPETPAKVGEAVRATVSVVHHGKAIASCTIEESLEQLSVRWAPCNLRWERSLRGPAFLTARIEPRGHLYPPGLRLALADPILLPSGWARKDERAPQPIIVVLLDTLRADHLALYGYSRPLGINLAALARDGILFKTVRAPSSWTRASVATLLTGLSPFSHRVMGREDRLSDPIRSLPEILQRAGYLTAAWSTNPNVLPLWGFGQGFDRFVDLDAFGWVRKASDARRVFAAARRYLEDAPGERVFLYLHLNDPHAPYLPPEGALRHISTMASAPLPVGVPAEVDRAKLKNQLDRYDAEILYTDKELGRFLRWLKRAGLYDPALIVVVGDHGEEFREHGGIFHGRTLYEEVLRVPLVVKLPGNRRAGSVVEGPVGLEDIAPTVAGLAGVADQGSFEGEDLLERLSVNSEEDPAASYASIVLDTVRAFSVTAGGHKLILGRDGSTLLFDLARDPGERFDLAAREPARVARLRSLLEGRIARSTSGWHIKGCGGPRLPRLDAVVESTEEIGAVRHLGLERSDRVLLAPNKRKLELHYSLGKRVAVVEVLGRLRQKNVFDEDEVVIAAAGTRITLRFTGNRKSAVSYRLGSGTAAGSSDVMTLSPDEPRALDRPSAEHACTTNMLLIWYVPEAESVAAEAVDPTVRERLRRLGYIE